MKFSIVSGSSLPAQAVSQCFLIHESWDDWFVYETRFILIVYDTEGKIHSPGRVKIGQVGMQRGTIANKAHPPTRIPDLPDEFENLGEQYFSIGQEDNYYESLNALGEDVRKIILIALRDCAYELSIFSMNKNEDVMQTSLLRSLTEENVLNRFHRLANGNAVLTRFHFSFQLPTREGVPAAKMSFLVNPGAEPPTNVHVLIGRNGVGKSRCIQSLTSTVLDLEETYELPKGELVKLGANALEWSFSGLVHVSFSAFDSFAFPPTANQSKIKGTFVGLPNLDIAIDPSGPSKNLKEILAIQFLSSFHECRSGLRASRWLQAVKTLCTDPMFEEANIQSLIDSDQDWESKALFLFKKLSSGHSIVLLTITRLVELVDERTLVILDEPEGHLHPPLLSAFIRAVSNLLVERNGVAIVATHSPVVLQEVPKTCVSILNRSGSYNDLSRPESETFGEAVGVLTHEVFGLEVSDSGFHTLVGKKVRDGVSFEDLMQHFDSQLGTEAQLLARSLIATRRLALRGNS